MDTNKNLSCRSKRMRRKKLLVTSLVILLCACGDKYTSEQETNPQSGPASSGGVVETEEIPDDVTTGSFENLMIQSMSSTDHCIAEINGALALAECEPTNDEFRWSYNTDDGSMVNKASGMCMQSDSAADGSTLATSFCSLSPEQSWLFNDSILSQNGFAFDVNMTELTFILWTIHGGMNQQWTITDTLFVAEQVTQEQQFTEQLIVNQAKTSLCIVLSELDEVVIEECDATNPKHLWSYDASGSLISSSNELCMANGDSGLLMDTCEKSSTQVWTFNDKGFSQNGFSFDLSLTDLSLLLYWTHGGANQRWLIPSHAQVEIDTYTGGEITYPITIAESLKYNIDVYKDLINRLTPVHTELLFPRNISNFPGVVGENEIRINKTISIDRNFYLSETAGINERQDWQSTGLYAVAGEVIIIDVKSTDDMEVAGLEAIINVHSDVLTLGVGNVENQLKRFSNVQLRIPLKSGINELRSQYGGLVVIASKMAIDAQFDIEIGNVVQAPYFILGTSTVEDFTAMQALDVPWGVMESNHMTLNISKASIAVITDPIALLQDYDVGMTAVKDLAGFDVDATEAPHKAPSLRERIIDDVQITYGFAHAGYPIMTSPGWETHKQDTASDGGWGNWHEVGHNYQQSCLWSTAFGSETTNNLFPLYVQDLKNITQRIVTESRYTSAIRKIDVAGGQLNHLDDADVWERLVFLMQIKHAFPGKGSNQGWDIYRQLQRKFRELNADTKTLICASNEASYDKTFELLSAITGHDLTEHFQTWGVPLSEASLQLVSELALPAPEVNISEINPEIANMPDIPE